MRPSLSNPWCRDDSAKRTNHELQRTLDPNKKYHHHILQAPGFIFTKTINIQITKHEDILWSFRLTNSNSCINTATTGHFMFEMRVLHTYIKPNLISIYEFFFFLFFIQNIHTITNIQYNIYNGVAPLTFFYVNRILQNKKVCKLQYLVASLEIDSLWSQQAGYKNSELV